MDWLPIFLIGSRAVSAAAGEVALKYIQAMCGFAAKTACAATAGLKTQDDMITGRDFCHRSACFFNHSRSFMAENTRQGHRIDLIPANKVSMTNTGTCNSDQHFIIP